MLRGIVAGVTKGSENDGSPRPKPGATRRVGLAELDVERGIDRLDLDQSTFVVIGAQDLG